MYIIITRIACSDSLCIQSLIKIVSFNDKYTVLYTIYRWIARFVYQPDVIL